MHHGESDGYNAHTFPAAIDPLTTILLRTNGLTCERDGRVLFSGLDFELRGSQIVELTGPNGSGKTTLLRSLAGLTSEYEGEVERPMPFLYQGHRTGLNALLTPLENLRWFAMLHGLDADVRHLCASLARLGMAGYEDTPCQFLSAGQQRRVLLTRLQFCLDQGGPPLWLLDEPLTALDVEGCTLVRRILGAHAGSGGGALCATHQRLQMDGALDLVLGEAA
jgi:heme exporter protein A